MEKEHVVLCPKKYKSVAELKQPKLISFNLYIYTMWLVWISEYCAF